MHFDFNEKKLIGGIKYKNGVVVNYMAATTSPNARPNDDCLIRVDKQVSQTTIFKRALYTCSGFNCGGCAKSNIADGVCWEIRSETEMVTQRGESVLVPCTIESEPPITLPPTFDPVLRDMTPDIMLGGGGTISSLSNYQQQMCGFVEQMLVETDKVEPQVIISNNNDAVSAQRFTLYVQLLYDAMKKELQKDPTMAHYAATIQYPTANSQLVIQAAKEFGNGTGNGTLNYSSAACKLTSLFLNDNPTQTKADEEKLNKVFETVVEKAKNSYSALVPILNTCTEVVSTSNTSGVYCTAQANWAKEIAQIIQDSNLPISETIQWSNDGTPVIAGIKGVDLWSKILALHPTIPVENIPPLKQRIVIGNLEIIYTRFSTSTDDGKITYKVTENNASSNLDLYFLDDDDNLTEAEVIPDNPPVLNSGFSDFTSYQFQQYLINCGVRQQVYDDFDYLSTTEKKDQQFYFRSGRIFEKAVQDCFGFSNSDKKSFFVSPTSKPKSVIPDLHDRAGVGGKEIRNSQNVNVTYWWEHSVFRDAKITFKSDQKINYTNNGAKNEDQIEGFLEVLSKMNDAYYHEGRKTWAELKMLLGLGTPVKKNAAKSGAAILHIITPAGVTLDAKILSEAGKRNVILLHSVTEFNPITKEFRLKQGVILNKELLSPKIQNLLNNRTLTDNGYTFGGTATIDCFNTK
jgi:hypothetical protein